MHSQLIEKAAEDGIDTIITCDNGIAASAEIQQAKEKGMTVGLSISKQKYLWSRGCMETDLGSL